MSGASASSYTGTQPTPTMRALSRRYRSRTHQERPMTTTHTAPKFAPSLQDALLAAVDALARRRACDIPEHTIDRLVALRWLRWSAGSLRLTEAGEATVVRLQAALLDDERLAA
jgi:hypothetical protein